MSRNDDTIIRLSGLKPGRYTYDFTLGKEFFDDFENEEIRDGNVQIGAILEKTERVTTIKIALHGEVTTLCDRCLGEMRVPIEGEETLLLRFSDTEESDDENVAILPEGANEIDLSQWLYEYVAVRIPLQHSHEEGECDPETVSYIKSEEELVREHEENREVDPRWEALKGLKGEE